MKIRLARKISVTRVQRRGTVIAAMKRLPLGEYVAINRWWWTGRVRARMAALGAR